MIATEAPSKLIEAIRVRRLILHTHTHTSVMVTLLAQGELNLYAHWRAQLMKLSFKP